MEEKKKKRPARGEAGYLASQKKYRVKKTLLYVLIGIAIFVLGLCLNKFEKTNIFTVIAVLMVLPAAKAFVGVIVLFPYHSVESVRVENVQKLLSGADVMYTDMVFTSPDKVMFLAFLVIAQDEILCLAGREKEDIRYIEKYLREELKKRMLLRKLYVTMDEEKFLDRVARAKPAEEMSEELTAYLKSLMA